MERLPLSLTVLNTKPSTPCRAEIWNMSFQCYNVLKNDNRPPLRCGLGVNIVTPHAAGPGSILGRINFLVEVFPGLSLNHKTNVRKFVPHSSPVIICRHIAYNPNHISSVYWRRRSLAIAVVGYMALVNKQQQLNEVILFVCPEIRED